MTSNHFPQDLDHPEFFHSRGLGNDGGFPCLVTGAPLELATNIAAFVISNEAGERVVAMLGGRARLDYRDHSPERVQVKLGVTKGHEHVLARLHRATLLCGGVITPKMIAWALDPEGKPGLQPYALRNYDELRDRVLKAVG